MAKLTNQNRMRRVCLIYLLILAIVKKSMNKRTKLKRNGKSKKTFQKKSLLMHETVLLKFLFNWRHIYFNISTSQLAIQLSANRNTWAYRISQNFLKSLYIDNIQQNWLAFIVSSLFNNSIMFGSTNEQFFVVFFGKLLCFVNLCE